MKFAGLRAGLSASPQSQPSLPCARSMSLSRRGSEFPRRSRLPRPFLSSLWGLPIRSPPAWSRRWAADGNVTGLSFQQTDLAGKQLELLREVVPGLRHLAIVGNANAPGAVREMGVVQASARTLGLEVATSEIRRAEDFAAVFEALTGRVDALYVCTDGLITTNSIRFNNLAMAARLPTTYVFREDVAAGGLMSYGPNFSDVYRRAADYVDKILRGAKPADIPIEQPTKFDLVINLITAKALGLTVSPSFLARADEVIEYRRGDFRFWHIAAQSQSGVMSATGGRRHPLGTRGRVLLRLE